MKKETQRTVDLIEEDLDYMIYVQRQYSIGEHLLSKYVYFDDKAEQYVDAVRLKDYCKRSVRFLKEARIKWAQVEWDIVGERLKEQEKADEWIENRHQECLKWIKK